jgi:esterase FrsA
MRKLILVAAMALLGATQANSQGAEWRSLDEVKAEVMRRAGKINPFDHIKPDDAASILKSINSLDRDEWAKAWCKVGMEYEARGDERAKQGAPSAELADIYHRGFHYCMLARYPAPTSPGKLEAYNISMRIFRKAAPHFDPPAQVVETPFRDTKLVGYLRVPKSVARPPVVINWGGVDTWKEDRMGAADRMIAAGMAVLNVDMPGTGENPTRYGDPDAYKTYSAWLDFLEKRSDVDGSRVGLWGLSFGGYWAARMAYEEPRRVRGAVFHGGNAHIGFQREWLVPAFTTGGATYLFGAGSLLEARSRAMGTKTMEEFLNAAPKLSLVSLGLVDKPSAPILGVNGKLDDQAPAADIMLLMEHGSPKTARIFSKGRHMGREPGMDETLIPNMIIGWLKEQLTR